MLRRYLLLALTFLVSSLTVAVAEERGDWTVVQPTEARRDLMLWSRPGEARIEHKGEVRTFALASGEQLTTIAAVDGGWIAAGRHRDATGRSTLMVVTEDGGGLRKLDDVSPEGGRVQVKPALLVDGGRFEGVAWLEGESAGALAVRARGWNGADWAPLEPVSRPGRGSQTGLSATVLRDGSSLLVWSAFDGVDDEIKYAVGRGGVWQAPRRLGAGNRVPDVAPSVIATRRGALAAWSRLEGGAYELVVARYRRGKWQAPRVLGRGLFPRFNRIDERLFLLYRTAEPRGWGVMELDAKGAPERRASFLATAPDRPSIELRDATGPNLRWPARASARGYWDLP